jgi:hypothetical protein
MPPITAADLIAGKLNIMPPAVAKPDAWKATMSEQIFRKWLLKLQKLKESFSDSASRFKRVRRRKTLNEGKGG